MEYIGPFVDFRHSLTCIHCGAPKDGRPFTRDHLPTKSLLNQPLPVDLPTLEICDPCNNQLSRDEEYLKVLLSCIFMGTCEPAELQDARVARALGRNGPLLAALRHARTTDFFGRVTWQPDFDRLKMRQHSQLGAKNLKPAERS